MPILLLDYNICYLVPVFSHKSGLSPAGQEHFLPQTLRICHLLLDRSVRITYDAIWAPLVYNNKYEQIEPCWTPSEGRCFVLGCHAHVIFWSSLFSGVFRGIAWAIPPWPAAKIKRNMECSLVKVWVAGHEIPPPPYEVPKYAAVLALYKLEDQYWHSIEINKLTNIHITQKFEKKCSGRIKFKTIVFEFVQHSILLVTRSTSNVIFMLRHFRRNRGECWYKSSANFRSCRMAHGWIRSEPTTRWNIAISTISSHRIIN